MIRILAVCLTLYFLPGNLLFCQEDTAFRPWGEWKTWGDAGNGRFDNPVLPGDYSDIDAIRVGSDYYSISSTSQFSPGMIVLHSKDLVNWEIIGHVVKDLTQISPEMNWDKMNRTGNGVWAGAIRYHAGKFWVYFGTPDEGYFMSTSLNPKGPWSPLYPVLAQPGWDDCCPFWDDDGQGYLVGTHFGDGYTIHLFKLSADGKSLIPGTDKIIHQSEGSEANKLYKIRGLYYHLFSEVKSEGRAIMMERSKHIYGPYTEIRQLSHAQRSCNEPNQGGLVQTAQGDWYFLTHHGTGDWSGRAVSLLPVHWTAGWPVIGAIGSDTIGTMVWSGEKPVASNKKCILQTDDEFDEAALPPQWEWNYQPRAQKWSLTERPGWLRLYAFKTLRDGSFLNAGNTLTQRSMRTADNTVIMKLDIGGMVTGQKAGLAHFGVPSFSTLGVSCDSGGRHLELNSNGDITMGPSLTGNDLWLKSMWGLDGKSQYFYSPDGKIYTAIGQPYMLKWGAYRGDRIAIYCYNEAEAGSVDVDFFRYEYGPTGL